MDGLRAISILLVMAGHMLWIGPKALQLNFAAGAMGMAIFFSLSGFLITSTLMRNPSVSEFIIRRMSRILPLALGYAVLIFTFVYFDPAAVLWTASFILNYFPDHFVGGYNSHLWSLCVEIHFYLAIAIAVALLGRRGLWLIFPGCLLVTALRIHSGNVYPYETHLRVDEILVGAVVAYLFNPSWRLRYPAALVFAAFAALMICSHPSSGPLQYFRAYAAALLLAAALCNHDTRVAKVLGSAPLRYIATISYALYVFHLVTIQGWFNEGSILERFALKRPLSFVISFAAAHLSTFHWERYWLKKGRDLIAKRRGSATAPPKPLTANADRRVAVPAVEI